MIKILTSIIIFTLSINLYGDYNTGKKLFKTKCASCHIGYISKKILEDNFYKKDNKLLNLKAPTVNMLVYFMKDATTHIGDKNDPEMQRVEIESFIEDYVYNPNRNNSVIKHRFLKYFDKKKSMKGLVSKDELSNITDYLFEYKEHRSSDIQQVRLKNMSIKELIKEAEKKHKLLLIEAMSKTCYYCEKMKKEVISLPDVQKAINKNFIYIPIDIDKDKLPLHLEKKFKHITPTFFALTPEGKLLHDYAGAWDKSDFLLILKENLKK